VANVIKLGDHGTTFGGAPLATRVGVHVMQRILEPSFIQHIQSVGAHLAKRLSALPGYFPEVVAGPHRGRGLIVGLPFKTPEQPGQVIKLCRERGLLLLTCGNNTVRFVPSLTITKEEVDKACDILESALTLLVQESVPKQPPSGQMMP
jgi:acetylornithine aminotransferase